jgi:hypothetical protein
MDPDRVGGLEMTSLTVALPRTALRLHPDRHRIAGAARVAFQKARAIFRVENPRECKRYEFLEDSLMAREMLRL